MAKNKKTKIRFQTAPGFIETVKCDLAEKFAVQAFGVVMGRLPSTGFDEENISQWSARIITAAWIAAEEFVEQAKI